MVHGGRELVYQEPQTDECEGIEQAGREGTLDHSAHAKRSENKWRFQEQGRHGAETFARSGQTAGAGIKAEGGGRKSETQNASKMKGTAPKN